MGLPSSSLTAGQDRQQLRRDQITPLALRRKNALFAGHEKGAQNRACIASLIATGKRNDVEPSALMSATLKAIAAGHLHTDLDDLLPFAFSTTAISAAV